MRTKILKMVLPAFVLMLAVFGAFAFKSVENKALLAPETGWINLPGDPCALPVQCNNSPSDFVCTAVHLGVQHQAYGKESPTSMVCEKILFRLD